MTRRFGYGDKVFVVLEGTVVGFNEGFDEVEIKYRTELGSYETKLAVDSASVQVHDAEADSVRIEYGARITNHDGALLGVHHALDLGGRWLRGRAKAEVERYQTSTDQNTDAAIVVRHVVIGEWREEDDSAEGGPQ